MSNELGKLGPVERLVRRITPRTVMRETLGRKAADSLIADLGIDWAVFVTVCAVCERDPLTPGDRAFLKWADRISQDDPANTLLTGAPKETE